MGSRGRGKCDKQRVEKLRVKLTVVKLTVSLVNDMSEDPRPLTRTLNMRPGTKILWDTL